MTLLWDENESLLKLRHLPVVTYSWKAIVVINFEENVWIEARLKHLLTLLLEQWHMEEHWKIKDTIALSGKSIFHQLRMKPMNLFFNLLLGNRFYDNVKWRNCAREYRIRLMTQITEVGVSNVHKELDSVAIHQFHNIKSNGVQIYKRGT
jgi:hypothetical protein